MERQQNQSLIETRSRRVQHLSNKRVWTALAWLMLLAASVPAFIWFPGLTGGLLAFGALIAELVWFIRRAERALRDGR
jgi:hypothetical protein